MLRTLPKLLIKAGTQTFGIITLISQVHLFTVEYLGISRSIQMNDLHNYLAKNRRELDLFEVEYLGITRSIKAISIQMNEWQEHLESSRRELGEAMASKQESELAFQIHE